jgi:holo-[acyl-carrier protein] synthase
VRRLLTGVDDAVIAGIGVDACEITRLKRALAGSAGARFKQRVFTAGEQAYCDARGRARYESYAARFAAKEAAMKALGTGWGRGLGFTDVEVERDDEAAPRLVLHGEAARVAARLGVVRCHLSLTHTRTTAIAWVLCERVPRRS